ncbi:uncharacterized protein LOC125211901 isoform X1 [Salvia hispanica]|uniref:uncharacterized protein LOC125211901 isoform X1 n=1 Tax=Salvia hispanica TaxID=49212 RepID=UPI002009D9E5|nr:uncharacterized protein LOC125211901 isoform X1 [Salvia hispanica]
MVCIACLLPLFLVPIVNLLPVIFDLIMAKVYGLFGWEYRKPARPPAACPIRPSAAKTAANGSVSGKEDLAAATADSSPKPIGVDDCKQD